MPNCVSSTAAMAMSSANTAISVITIESPSREYGTYSWPCGPVLAQHIWDQRKSIAGKKVLELGGGTAAPGITAAKCGALVTLTDADSPRLMDHLMETCRLNNMEDVQVLPLTWGTFSEELLSLPPVDYILASDCLYQSTNFEDFLVTVSYLMEQNSGCRLWMTYQERSSDTCLSYFFKRWGLTAKVLPLPVSSDITFPNIPPHKLHTQHNIILWEISATNIKSN